MRQRINKSIGRLCTGVRIYTFSFQQAFSQIIGGGGRARFNLHERWLSPRYVFISDYARVWNQPLEGLKRSRSHAARISSPNCGGKFRFLELLERASEAKICFVPALSVLSIVRPACGWKRGLVERTKAVRTWIGLKGHLNERRRQQQQNLGAAAGQLNFLLLWFAGCVNKSVHVNARGANWAFSAFRLSRSDLAKWRKRDAGKKSCERFSLDSESCSVNREWKSLKVNAAWLEICSATDYAVEF